MQLRIHEAYRKIVSLADTELLGKKFSEGIMELEVKEDFFKGEEITEEEAILILKKMQREDATFNIVGIKAIKTALRAGIISEKAIKTVEGIPVALSLL